LRHGARRNVTRQRISVACRAGRFGLQVPAPPSPTWVLERRERNHRLPKRGSRRGNDGSEPADRLKEKELTRQIDALAAERRPGCGAAPWPPSDALAADRRPGCGAAPWLRSDAPGRRATRPFLVPRPPQRGLRYLVPLSGSSPAGKRHGGHAVLESKTAAPRSPTRTSTISWRSHFYLRSDWPETRPSAALLTPCSGRNARISP